MTDEDPLGLEKRRRIYQEIVQHPGLHLRELERRFGFGLGDLRHHLDLLEEKNLIASRMDGYRKTYIPTRGFLVQNAALVALLRQEAPRTIITFLMELPTAGFEDIRVHLNVSKSTLSFHLRKLVANGIVIVERQEARRVYRIRDKDRVAELIVTYRESFLDDAIDRVARTWMP